LSVEALQLSTAEVLVTLLALRLDGALGGWVSAATPKVAVTDWAALRVTAQVPVPLQAPLQPVKAEPAAACAVSVTTVPLVYVAAQVVEQPLMPDGEELTVPEPEPDLTTVRV
jgi:hypothetical protein